MKGGWGFAHAECCRKMMERLVDCPFMSCAVLFLAALMGIRLLMRLVELLSAIARRLTVGRALSSYGEWAVITGASDGIGRALAGQLAAKGIRKIMLVARNDQKLKDVETELTSSGPMEVSRLVIDFNEENMETTVSKITEATKNLDVGILVNNVGISYPHALYYDEVPTSLLSELLNVNVRSVFAVTRAIYPGMKARKRGLIVCVGSGASELPSDPLYAGYAASKAAVEGFCRALQVEAAPFGVEVQCHVPLLVTTKLSKCKTPGLTVLTAESYAAAAVRAMTHASSSRHPTLSPSFIHAYLLWGANMMPRFLWHKHRMSQTKGIRDRALKKKGDEKKES